MLLHKAHQHEAGLNFGRLKQFVHQPDITAKVTRSPTNPEKAQISLEHLANADLSDWDLGELTEQVMALWMERNFERD